MMRSETKKRVVIGALALLTTWPLVHIGLVWRYDLSPWKLGAWGMYAAPRYNQIGMEVFGRVSETGATEQVTAPSEVVRLAANRFLERYRWLRDLAPPRSFARVVLSDHPKFDRVTVQVFRPHMDARSGMIEMKVREYVYDR
jgi:hypothetical protein